MTPEERRHYIKRQQQAYDRVNEHLQPHGIGLFNVDGQLEIQRIDETHVDQMDDEDAVIKVVEMALSGDPLAAMALYLDGRPGEHERYFWPSREFEAPRHRVLVLTEEGGEIHRVYLVPEGQMSEGAMQSAQTAAVYYLQQLRNIVPEACGSPANVEQDIREINGEGDGPTCAQCGKPMFHANGGIAHHSNPDDPDGIDHDADADHTPIDDSEYGG